MCPFEKIENLLNNFRKKKFQKFSDRSEIFFCFSIHKKLNKSFSFGSLKNLLFLFSQKDTHTAFSFLFPSVLLSCYHHLKAKLGMYFAPSIFEDFRMVCPSFQSFPKKMVDFKNEVKNIQVTPFENAQRWMGKNTFHFLLLNDDNMIGEH